MRVGIAGDGIAGRTLYHYLKIRGLQVDLYGQEKHTNCNIRPCGFGTSASCIKLVAKLDISSHEYVLRHDNYIRINGRRIKGDLYWIDKPKLLKAITTDIRYDKPDIDAYDVMVDATGIARAYCPLLPDFNDKLGISYQHRVVLNNEVTPAFDVIRGGYLWTIPLGRREVHLGGGSTILPSIEIKRIVSDHVKDMKPNEIICSCSEPLRLSGPIFPVVAGKVVTVGESAGLVVPFGAAGIYTAFESATILADHIYRGDITGYHKAIQRHFGWLRGIREILDNSERGQVTLLSLVDSNRALRYQGLKPKLWDLLYIRNVLIEVNKQPDKVETVD